MVHYHRTGNLFHMPQVSCVQVTFSQHHHTLVCIFEVINLTHMDMMLVMVFVYHNLQKVLQKHISIEIQVGKIISNGLWVLVTQVTAVLQQQFFVTLAVLTAVQWIQVIHRVMVVVAHLHQLVHIKVESNYHRQCRLLLYSGLHILQNLLLVVIGMLLRRLDWLLLKLQWLLQSVFMKMLLRSLQVRSHLQQLHSIRTARLHSDWWTGFQMQRMHIVVVMKPNMVLHWQISFRTSNKNTSMQTQHSIVQRM